MGALVRDPGPAARGPPHAISPCVVARLGVPVTAISARSRVATHNRSLGERTRGMWASWDHEHCQYICIALEKRAYHYAPTLPRDRRDLESEQRVPCDPYRTNNHIGLFGVRPLILSPGLGFRLILGFLPSFWPAFPTFHRSGGPLVSSALFGGRGLALRRWYGGKSLKSAASSYLRL